VAHTPIYQAEPGRPPSRAGARRRLGMLLGVLVALTLVGSGLGRGFIVASEQVGLALGTAEPNQDRPGLIAALRAALQVGPTQAAAVPEPASLHEALEQSEPTESVAEFDADPAEAEAEPEPAPVEAADIGPTWRQPVHPLYVGPLSVAASPEVAGAEGAWLWQAAESGRPANQAPRLAKSSRKSSRSDLALFRVDDQDQQDRDDRNDDPASGEGQGDKVGTQKGHHGGADDEVAGDARQQSASDDPGGAGDKGRKNGSGGGDDQGARGNDNRSPKNPPDGQVAKTSEENSPKGGSENPGGKGGEDKGGREPSTVARAGDDRSGKGNDDKGGKGPDKGGKGGGDDKGGKGKH
jgi:hypothetical protein